MPDTSSIPPSGHFMLPLFITFTGVDEFTDPTEMMALSSHFPIEWAFLFSPERQGKAEHPRYPRLDFVEDLVGSRLRHNRLAAHLCGAAARSVMQEGKTGYDALLNAHFMRVQVNTAEPQVEAIAKWARGLSVFPIVQCRGPFPRDPRVHYLFDTSGGRGVAPQSWPGGLDTDCGYAGGINPGNAAEVVATIGNSASTYWIDMESGVRDENDRFSLKRCRAVCEAVYVDLARKVGLKK